MGRYRISYNGFTAKTWTRDDMLERDGAGDEVFVSWALSGQLVGQTLVEFTNTSLVMGDVFGRPDRVKGGTASRFGTGGFKTGDEFPHARPWARQLPYGRVPPIRIWEGELTSNTTLTIAPLIWEADSENADARKDLEIAAVVHDVTASALGVVTAAVPNPVTPIIAGIVELVAVILKAIGASILPAGTRPIGAEFGQQPTRALRLRLNQDAAEQLATTDYGYGPGIIGHTFSDPPEWGEGEYTIYLQVERIGALEQPPPDETLVSLRLKRTANADPLPVEDIIHIGIPHFPWLGSFRARRSFRVVRDWTIDLKAEVTQIGAGTLAPKDFFWFLDGQPIKATKVPELKTTAPADDKKHIFSVLITGDGDPVTAEYMTHLSSREYVGPPRITAQDIRRINDILRRVPRDAPGLKRIELVRNFLRPFGA